MTFQMFGTLEGASTMRTQPHVTSTVCGSTTLVGRCLCMTPQCCHCRESITPYSVELEKMQMSHGDTGALGYFTLGALGLGDVELELELHS